MDLTALIYIALGAVGSTFAWLVLGPQMTGLGVKRLAARGSEAARKDAKKRSKREAKDLEFWFQLGDILIAYAAEPRIDTGETIRVATDKVDAEGKPIYIEQKEILSPIQLLARTIGSYVMMKFKGSVGGTKNQVKQMFMDSMSETGGGPPPAALQALSRGNIGPMIAEIGMPYVQELLNKKKGAINTQGGEGNYLK